MYMSQSFDDLDDIRTGMFGRVWKVQKRRRNG